VTTIMVMPDWASSRHDVEDLVDHLGVQSRGRLVEEHDLGPIARASRDRDALLLTTRELRGVLVGLRRDADPLEQLHRVLFGLGLALLADLDRPEGDVLEDRLVREEVEGLEHHADVGAQLRQRLSLVGQGLAVDGDGAGLVGLQPVDRAAQRRLARSGRTEHDDDLALADVRLMSRSTCSSPKCLLSPVMTTIGSFVGAAASGGSSPSVAWAAAVGRSFGASVMAVNVSVHRAFGQGERPLSEIVKPATTQSSRQLGIRKTSPG
jgi:hypothetical protein